MNMLLAHGATDEHPEGQSIEAHLKGTGELAETFAAEFGAAANGKLCGLAHDIGKYSDEFQLRLRGGKKVDHATAGAIECFKIKAAFEAVCVIGHHSGLPNVGHKDADTTESQTFFGRKLRAEQGGIPDYRKNWNGHIALPQDYFRPSGRGFATAFYIRMLYSCLVDADYIDTETFMNGDAGRGNYEPLSALCDKLTAYISKWNNPTREIDILRQKILNSCIEKASAPRGIFSLTVPTGGGKTVASMAFALNHAAANSMKRIIYAIPYTSIIEQNAKVFRDILGQENVVEHHSQVSYELSENADELEYRSALATENWDAPIIVTTNVQFFESLYACRTSRCRKLHNICNSVVILDEAQMLPVEFLQPILDILQSVQSSFKTSILFTTATLPVFACRIGTGQKAFSGLKSPVTEITSMHDHLFEAFKRVELHWLESTTTFDDLADELSGYDCVLCIVNTRKEARELYQRMPEGTLHLSRMMCSVHIMEVIKLIKQKLKDNEPVRVISTQLVEAGVDIDFPIVYRAFAGLDSIIQAAGRCNREGKLNKKGELGQVFVCKPEKSTLRGVMGKGAAALREMLSISDGSDLFSPDCMAQYFRLFYSNCNTFDKAEIKDSLYKGAGEMNFHFATAADQFRLIDDKDSVSILVGYGDGATLLEELKRIGPEFWLLRKLQQYSVSVRKWEFEQFRKQGTVGEYA